MRSVPVPLLPAWLRWAAVAVVAGAVFAFSLVLAPAGEPVVGPPELIPLDKWRHFFAYAAVGGSLAYATADWDWPTRRLAVAVVGATVAYGLGVELVQWPLPERFFGLGDAWANALGAALVLPWFLVRERLTFVAVPGDLLRGR